MKLLFSRQIFEKYSNIKFRDSVQWEPSSSMRTDEQTDRQDEVNSRFSKFLENPYKRQSCYLVIQLLLWYSVRMGINGEMFITEVHKR